MPRRIGCGDAHGLRWTKAETSLDFTPEASSPATAVLRGKAAIYQGFYPRRNTLQVRLGGRTADLTFTEPAVTTAEGIRWQVLGANAQGVLLTDELEFELTLNGPTWRQAVSEAGLKPDALGRVELPVKIALGPAHHVAPVPLTVTHEGRRVHARLP